MRTSFVKHAYRHLPLAIIGLAVLLGVALGVLVITFAHASTPLTDPGPGFLDFSYGSDAAEHITGEKPESKLWWNDGYWWGSLFNETAGEYHIYRLDWGNQNWVDTGVLLDDRPDSKADILWDGTHLYVLSHIFTDFSKRVAGSDNWGRLYRYSYDEPNQTYSLDNDFPVTVNEDQSEALVLDKDTTGRLWTAFVSREADNEPYQVYVNATNGDDQSWSTRFALTDVFTQAEVSSDDIASIISFRDDVGDKIGVMWSNQLTTSLSLNFATHDDSESNYQAGWSLTTVPVPLADPADDHISIRSLKETSSGQVFSVIKTNAISSTEALILLVARDSDGSFTFRPYSTRQANDTRPILLIDEGSLANSNDDQVYVFVTGKPGGSKICYKTLAITDPLNSMGDFPTGNCGTDFIESDTYDDIDNATSTKQNVNENTGIVILASDDITDHVYVHNYLGDPPPVVSARAPRINATDVSINAVVTAAFSKPMDDATIDGSTFFVEDGSGQVPGSVSYDAGTQTATFAPSTPLDLSTVYTVTIDTGVESTSHEPLYGAPEVWSFTTEPLNVRFSSASYSVGEGGGTATITVTLNTTSGSPVEVNYATSDNTATQGSDYTAVSDILTFDPGNIIETFNVPITDDLVTELDEFIDLTLSSPSGASLGTPSTASLSIIDNDTTPTVQFSAANFDVNEGDGSATVEVAISNPSSQPISVTYATSDNTALNGFDYTAVSNTLTIAPLAVTETFTVPILQDSFDEPNEAITLTLSSPVNASLGAPNPASLTILDDDLPPTVQFSEAGYNVNEADATATITVTLSAPSGQSVQVNYTTSDGTAEAGLDYTSVSDTLTFAPLAVTETFTVPILQDSLNEPSETVTLTLSAPANAALGSPNPGTLTILDDDSLPTVQFSEASYSVNEGDGTATITVTLSAESGLPVEVDYATSDDTATQGSDYTAVSDTLTFNPGDTLQSFSVPIIDDSIDELIEAVSLTLTNPVNASLGSPSTSTLSIVDNDGVPTVQFGAANFSINEGDGNAMIEVTLSNPSSDPVTVAYISSDGTAVAGLDYTAVNDTLTFSPGHVSETFAVPILQDDLYESDETVNLALSSPVNAGLGAPVEAVLTIKDDGDSFVVYLPMITR
jgi:uncharacterized protein YcfL